MSDEKTPLLLPSSQAHSSNENSDSESLSTKLSSFRIPIYGTESGIRSGKTIPQQERITYSWNSLNVFTSSKNIHPKRKYLCCGESETFNIERKHIVKNVNGIAYPGELLAILGSSGAGKTTLLNALTFRSSNKVTVSGMRCINGIPATSNALISQSAYVQQDDLFIGNLTVKEHLVFQALVRMDKHISYEQRMTRVNEVISELALSKCQNTKIGIPGRVKGISGGEKKRLSFAAEVLTNPSLMFCDEPTSGLDSFMALNVVQVLKQLALTGKTVICTIHQPSSELYAMFDKLLLMAEGRIAFLGTPEEADVFFTQLEAPPPRNYNPADYFIQLLAIVPDKEEACKESNNMICDKFERSEMGVKIAIESTAVANTGTGNDLWLNGDKYRNPYKANWFNQFRVVLWRSWLSVMKEPLLVKIRMIQTAVIAILIGMVYFGQKVDKDGVMNINGALFLCLTNMTFQNTLAVVHVFASELPIFLRENRNGMYRTDVYFISKTIADLPIFIFMPMLFTCICYYMIGFNTQPDRFLVTCGILVLVANVATSFGYLISCVATTVSMALAIGPPILIPFLMFGGFFLNVDSIPVYLQWLSYLSWFKYGNEALMINQWHNVTVDCSTAGNSSCPANGAIVLETYSFQESHFFWDIIALFILMISFRFFALVALLVKTYFYEK